MLVAVGSKGGDHEKKPYSVVRVETSAALLANATDGPEGPQEESSDSEDEEPNAPDKVVAEPLEGGKEDCGKGVARKMTGKIGASVFRGIITKCE